jgi:hypothetical protein
VLFGGRDHAQRNYLARVLLFAAVLGFTYPSASQDFEVLEFMFIMSRARGWARHHRATTALILAILATSTVVATATGAFSAHD